MINNVLFILLAVSLFIVMFVSGGVARLFKAKRPFMFLAFLVVMLTIMMGVMVHEYYVSDSMIVLTSALATYSISLFLLMGMGVLDTIIASLAGITVMGLVLFTGGTLLDKYQESHVLDTMLNYVKDNQSLIPFSTFFPNHKQLMPIESEQEEFAMYSEVDLMFDDVERQKKILKNRIYHVVSLSDVQMLRGEVVRISKKNGDILKGSIIELRKKSVVVGIYIPDAKGLIEAPVSMSSIRKLEVYK